MEWPRQREFGYFKGVVTLPKIEFYVTNVCNLTCEHCNRFNNYKFKGTQRWADCESTYQEWAKLVDFKEIFVLGGEPLLVPDIIDWVTGIRKLWKPEVQIVTNGYRLNHVKDLYKTMLSRRVLIGVSLHNINDQDFICNEIKTFLQDPVTVTTNHPKYKNADYVFVDANNIEIPVWIQDNFTTSAIIRNNKNNLTLHNSDVNLAHENCDFARSKNYHFINGKFYKCGPAILLAEFDQQHPLDISEEDRQLLNAYKPLTLENYAEYHEEFFASLDNPIPQCKFCPEGYNFKKIFPVRKGSKKS